jgi:dCMP deaminase
MFFVIEAKDIAGLGREAMTVDMGINKCESDFNQSPVDRVDSTDHKRPSWDEYFANISHQVAERSTCLRRKVGAVLVRDKRILATGYNGAPSGIRHCIEIGCLRESRGIASGERHELCRGLHAEQNAIIQAALHGIAIEGASIYCTHQPCVLCAKMLINAGIREIFFLEGYPDELSVELLNEAGVKARQLLINNGF